MRRRAALTVLAAALGGVALLPASPASACIGTPCDQVNAVCKRFGGAECLG